MDLPTLQAIATRTWGKEDELKALKAELAILDQKITSELAPKQEKQDFGEEVKKDNSSNNHLENGTNAPARQSEIQDNKDSLVAEPLCNYSSHELIKGRSYVSRLRSI